MQIINPDTCGLMAAVLAALAKEHPTMTVGELAERLAAQPAQAPLTVEAFAGMTPEPQVRECKRCGHPVVALDAWGEKWTHADAQGYPLEMGKGCRAASYGRDGNWDDTLDRGWSATPAN